MISPEGIANAIGLHDNVLSGTSSDGGKWRNHSNRHSTLQDDDNDKTTGVLPVGQIINEGQFVASIVRAHSNESTGNWQEPDNEPEVEGGIDPQANNLQPHRAVSSSEMDFQQHESPSGFFL